MREEALCIGRNHSRMQGGRRVFVSGYLRHPHHLQRPINCDHSAEWLTQSKHTDVKGETALVGPA